MGEDKGLHSIITELFLLKMEQLYSDHGWEENEKHFSLQDLKLNIYQEISDEKRIFSLLFGL